MVKLELEIVPKGFKEQIEKAFRQAKVNLTGAGAGKGVTGGTTSAVAAGEIATGSKTGFKSVLKGLGLSLIHI